MEGDKFCTKCGAELPEGASFCPSCGASITGQPSADQRYYDPMMYGTEQDVRLGFSFFILIYGLLATATGLMCGVSYATLSEADYIEMVDYMSDLMGLDYWDYMPAWEDVWIIITSMFAVAASGVCAIVSYVYCRRADKWKYAFYTCLAASVLVLAVCVMSVLEGIMFCVIGLMFTYLIYSNRSAFSGRGRWRSTTSWTTGTGSRSGSARTPWATPRC